MTFLAPVFFYLGLGAAAAAVALHFIVTRQPPSSPLPTARFVPEGSLLVTTVARPTNLLLLLMRVLLAIVVGMAFARPLLVRKARPVTRIVVADISRAVGAIGAVRDSARALLRDGDVLVIFDSTARAIRRGAADSAAALTRSPRQGRLSAALIVALRSATMLRMTADSFELAIVSPVRAAELDGATLAIRKLWPGHIRLVRVPPSADSSAPAPGVMVRAGADDPVAIAATLGGVARADATVRIIREQPTADDNAWAARDRHTLVRWPADGAPPGWIVRPRVDTAGALVAGSGLRRTALVLPIERGWRLDPTAHPTRVAARWIDGEPAAVDYAVGDGCIRDVAVPVPTRGDAILRPAFARLLEALGAPCASAAGGPAASAQTLAALAGTGSLAAAQALAAPEMAITPLMPWLLAAALALAVLELFVRRSKA